jgi:CBS domain containing-hemolysin-like protein
MHGAINLGELKINDIYTPLTKVLPVYLDTVFNHETLKMIADTGFSRIPISYSAEYPYIIGILLVKKILINEATYSTLGEMYQNG